MFHRRSLFHVLLVAFLGLHTVTKSESPPPLVPLHATFTSWSESVYWSDCRFRAGHLPVLLAALRVPELVTTRSGFVFTGEEALLILLVRLATGLSLAGMEHRFGRRRTHICEVLFWMYKFIDETFGRLLKDVRRSLDGKLAGFANAVARVTGQRRTALVQVVGFVDGTARPCARPKGRQNIQARVFSYHKHRHSIKFLALTTPDGMFAYLSDPEPGIHHDGFIYRSCDMEDMLMGVLP